MPAPNGWTRRSSSTLTWSPAASPTPWTPSAPRSSRRSPLWKTRNRPTPTPDARSGSGEQPRGGGGREESAAEDQDRQQPEADRLVAQPLAPVADAGSQPGHREGDQDDRRVRGQLPQHRGGEVHTDACGERDHQLAGEAQPGEGALLR